MEPNGTPPGAWHPDPYGAGPLRWHDGTTWTQHVSPYAAPPPPGWITVPLRPPGSGRLVAAGVMGIVTGVVSLIIGIYLLSIASSSVGYLVDQLSGGMLTLAVLLTFAFALAFLWFGIAGVLRRTWSRLALAITSGVAGLLSFLGAFSDGDGGGLVSGMWFAVILGLAISFNPYAAPHRP